MSDDGLVSVPPFFWVAGEGTEPDLRPGAAVGHDQQTFLVTLEDGSVRSTDSAGVLPSRHVNASVQQFRACLDVFAAGWKSRRDLPEDAALSQARQVRREMTAIDPSAMAGTDNWWAVIIEQLECGPL